MQIRLRLQHCTAICALYFLTATSQFSCLSGERIYHEPQGMCSPDNTKSSASVPDKRKKKRKTNNRWEPLNPFSSSLTLTKVNWYLSSWLLTAEHLYSFNIPSCEKQGCAAHHWFMWHISTPHFKRKLHHPSSSSTCGCGIQYFPVQKHHGVGSLSCSDLA